jgi:hypothetical protein
VVLLSELLLFFYYSGNIEGSINWKVNNKIRHYSYPLVMSIDASGVPPVKGKTKAWLNSLADTSTGSLAELGQEGQATRFTGGSLLHSLLQYRYQFLQYLSLW